jgi:hypothetical protein
MRNRVLRAGPPCNTARRRSESKRPRSAANPSGFSSDPTGKIKAPLTGNDHDFLLKRGLSDLVSAEADSSDEEPMTPVQTMSPVHAASNIDVSPVLALLATSLDRQGMTAFGAAADLEMMFASRIAHPFGNLSRLFRKYIVG